MMVTNQFPKFGFTLKTHQRIICSVSVSHLLFASEPTGRFVKNKLLYMFLGGHSGKLGKNQKINISISVSKGYHCGSSYQLKIDVSEDPCLYFWNQYKPKSLGKYFLYNLKFIAALQSGQQLYTQYLMLRTQSFSC